MDPSLVSVSAGLLLGAAVGAVARRARFCTLGAIADALTLGDRRRLHAWGLAVAVAMIGTQTLQALEIVDLGRSIYLGPRIGWLGAALGGLLFGLGMALVGTCAFGSLIRIGDGDLRAIVSFLVIGVSAYATISGPLAYARVGLVEATDLQLTGAAAVDLPGLIGRLVPLPAAAIRLVVVVAMAGALIFAALRAGVARRPVELLAALVMGLAVIGGWIATGVLGEDEFEPVRVASLTFVRPIGEVVFYLMFMSGTSLGFGVATIVGVVGGAAAVSRKLGEQRLEAFDGVREMRRHLVGGALMGIGGVMALGCTIGQGITGLATLAPASFIAAPAIVAGTALGLRYLEAGSVSRMVRSLLAGVRPGEPPRRESAGRSVAAGRAPRSYGRR
jgi:uncharacterized membrane protein YedE/YeeE